MWLVVAVLFGAPGAFPAESLDDAWGAAWRRMFDRTGRLDPDGSLQQRLPDVSYVEYEMDRTTAWFALGDGARWAAQPGTPGAAGRLAVQSINEFTLLTTAQVVARAPAGRYGAVGARFDRHQTRALQSDLLRVDFEVHDDGRLLQQGTGSRLYSRLSPYPRWEKLDSDAELTLGARLDGWGEARLRTVALDPFVNAAFALAASRDAEPVRTEEQLDAPLGLALEVVSARFAGARGELYVGGLLPARTRLEHAETPLEDHVRAQEGWLVGGLLEWRPGSGPLAVGASMLQFATETRLEGFADPTRDRADPETYRRVRGYLLGTLPLIDLSAEAAVTWTTTEDAARDERRRLYHLRGWWMPTEVLGAEVGVMRGERAVTGADPVGGGVAHRITTRLALRLGPYVQGALGVGWDLDPGDGLYDGGGLTLVVVPP